MYTPLPSGQPPCQEPLCNTASLRTKILDFRAFDSSIIYMFSSGILMSIRRESTGMFDSTNLSRDKLSREIGRIWPRQSCSMIIVCGGDAMHMTVPG